uniref:Uncharacterized protein n=1 Tax=Panagrolaimus sp. ES5 TaxID=591445 RepID=A0AC34FQN9_9BILA
MDSPGSEETTSSNSVPKAEDASMITHTRASFFSSYRRRQPFSLPDSIIHYIAMNPKTSEFYQKMSQSCKYFFIKNPILIVPRLSVTYFGEWNLRFNNKSVDFKNISSKIWITCNIDVDNDDNNGDDKYFSSNVVPYIYQCDIKELTLCYQIISYNDFIFLASKCEALWFWYGVTVVNEDDTGVPLEKLIEAAPKIKSMHVSLYYASSNIITPNTVHELLKIPHFFNLTHFFFYHLPEVFDIETFYAYIKKNKKTGIYLHFTDEISEDFKNRLRVIVKEIVQTKNHNYKVPRIEFSGMYMVEAEFIEFID